MLFQINAPSVFFSFFPKNHTSVKIDSDKQNWQLYVQTERFTSFRCEKNAQYLPLKIWKNKSGKNIKIMKFLLVEVTFCD